MNDLQNKIYQLLQEMDSSGDTPEGVDKAHSSELCSSRSSSATTHLAQPAKNDQSENEKGEHVENVEKSKGKRKEKFLTLSSKPITLGKRSTRAETEIEEKPEIEHLLNIVETESIKDKE